MPENILIAVAWPYANAEIHVGNMTGSHLPGDIVARYHRLKGNKVLMITGTDSHGTPVTMSADKLGKPVEEVYKTYHEGFIELFKRSALPMICSPPPTARIISKFRRPSSWHCRRTDSCSRNQPQWYSPGLKRFLPDRYIEGTCYICGTEGARSDQCDTCGNVLDPTKLDQPDVKGRRRYVFA